MMDDGRRKIPFSRIFPDLCCLSERQASTAMSIASCLTSPLLFPDSSLFHLLLLLLIESHQSKPFARTCGIIVTLSSLVPHVSGTTAAGTFPFHPGNP